MLKSKNYQWAETDLLGKGGFGKVYKVCSVLKTFLSTDIHICNEIINLFFWQGISHDGKAVAIKTFKFPWLEMFEIRESATMATANHENIVKFFGFEKILDETDRYIIIMEMCGDNMENVINRMPNGLSSGEFIEFARNIIDAMQHLRNLNIIHRDVKPANILQSNQDGKLIYKLADFGAARFLEPSETYNSLYGSHEYMHPDLFAEFYRPDLDLSVPRKPFKDVLELWSIGITFFEMACGHLPFQPERGRDDPKAMFEMISKKGPNCISAKEVDGKIEWFEQLPEHCNLGNSLKEAITPFLVALLQVNNIHKLF